jgi:hypothetical protein
VLLHISSPLPGGTFSLPTQVSLHIELTEGPGASLVRATGIQRWRLCYATDGRWPLSCEPLPSEGAWRNLPPLHEYLLRHPVVGPHIFSAWLQEDGSNDEGNEVSSGSGSGSGSGDIRRSRRVGFKNFTFSVARPISSTDLRLRRWERDVAKLRRPHFIEIGTSFFETLAGVYEHQPHWTGVSVEPIGEYLAALPSREGLRKVNALVCGERSTRSNNKNINDDDTKNDDEENDDSDSSATIMKSLYSLDYESLMAEGMEYFFAGTSSSDPSHLWRSPETRARIPLDVFRGFIRRRIVPCVTYADLFEEDEEEEEKERDGDGQPKGDDSSSPSSSPTRPPITSPPLDAVVYLKVDAEGADVNIVRAAAADAAE